MKPSPNCCDGYGLRTSNDALLFTVANYITFSPGFPKVDETDSSITVLLVVVQASKNNSLCNDGNQRPTGASRKRRGIVVDHSSEIALSQSTLVEVLSDPSTVNQAILAIQTVYPGLTITMAVTAPTLYHQLQPHQHLSRPGL